MRARGLIVVVAFGALLALACGSPDGQSSQPGALALNVTVSIDGALPTDPRPHSVDIAPAREDRAPLHFSYPVDDAGLPASFVVYLPGSWNGTPVEVTVRAFDESNGLLAQGVGDVVPSLTPAPFPLAVSLTPIRPQSDGGTD